MTYHPDSPTNAKYWGYLPELKDPRWFALGRVGGNTTLGIPLMSPDEDEMKIIAFNYWLKDEDDVTKQRPVYRVLLFIGGSKTSPVGAKLWQINQNIHTLRESTTCHIQEMDGKEHQ